jgi:tRNA threonylcarbamoyladenosine biosynthesis protein TsaE
METRTVLRPQLELTMTTHGVDETQALGARLAAWLQPGDVLALSGDLGAGKTAFTQGLAWGMGISRPVTSPTFTLINQYRAGDGRVLQHVDCYRLANAPLEMWDAGLSDFFAGSDIVVIEWADRIPGLLPDEYLEIAFTYVDDSRRQLLFRSHGERYERLVGQFAV